LTDYTYTRTQSLIEAIKSNQPTLADAIMDRLTANAHRVELKGESMRQRNRK